VPARRFPYSEEETVRVEPLDLRSLSLERATRLLRDMLSAAEQMHEEANARLLRDRARAAVALMHPRTKSLLLDRMSNVHREVLRC
jgi:hypothetical protein